MNEKNRIDTGSLGSGIALIVVGTLFFLDRFMDMDFGDTVRTFWPMILVVIGVPKLFQYRTLWSGLWLITVGVWLQVNQLELFGVTWRNSWPLLLIVLGAGMIVRSFVDASVARRSTHEY